MDQLGKTDAGLKEEILKGKKKLVKQQPRSKTKLTKKLTADQVADVAVRFMEKEHRKFDTVKATLSKKEGRDLSNREALEVWATECEL